MSNLPDDWGAYRRKSPECGHHYHLSGTEECKCPPETFPCEHPTCDEKVEDEGKLTMLVSGESWCAFCVDYHGFTCTMCEEATMDADRANTDTDEAYCIHCDEECKENKIRHHAATVVVVEEAEETTSERIIRAQIEGGINARD